MPNTPQNATYATALTVPQEKAIEALVSGATVTEAARTADVDRGTVHRWLKQPEFGYALNRAKWERREAIQRSMAALGLEAVETLRTLLTDPEVPPAVRLKAALSVLPIVKGLEVEAIGFTEPRPPATPAPLDAISRTYYGCFEPWKE